MDQGARCYPVVSKSWCRDQAATWYLGVRPGCYVRSRDRILVAITPECVTERLNNHHCGPHDVTNWRLGILNEWVIGSTDCVTGYTDEMWGDDYSRWVWLSVMSLGGACVRGERAMLGPPDQMHTRADLRHCLIYIISSICWRCTMAVAATAVGATISVAALVMLMLMLIRGPLILLLLLMLLLLPLLLLWCWCCCCNYRCCCCCCCWRCCFFWCCCYYCSC